MSVQMDTYIAIRGGWSVRLFKWNNREYKPGEE